MITKIDGFKVGHYTDTNGMTGCTAILCPPDTVGSCEIRGSSPGSRETALLAPDKSMMQVNAILLTGGSAFGLEAAGGVMQFLKEKNIGYQTPWGVIPIVPTAVVFDLNVGRNDVFPQPEHAYHACEKASDGEYERGCVGAGTGTTVGKWMGPEYWMKGGVGTASITHNDLIISAIAVVNSIGDVYSEENRMLAGARHPDGGFWAEVDPSSRYSGRPLPLETNTTLIVVVTNARFSKLDVHRICQRAHTGMARAIKPVNTSHDGDCIFGLATGTIDAQFDVVAEMAADATAHAIRDGVVMAKSVGDIPGLAGEYT